MNKIGTGIFGACATVVLGIITNKITDIIPVDKEPEKETTVINLSVSDLKKSSALPSKNIFKKIKLTNKKTHFIDEIQTEISASFRSFEDQSFAKINVHPLGKKSQIMCAKRGEEKTIRSSSGYFKLTVYEVNYERQEVVVMIKK